MITKEVAESLLRLKGNAHFERYMQVLSDRASQSIDRLLTAPSVNPQQDAFERGRASAFAEILREVDNAETTVELSKKAT